MSFWDSARNQVVTFPSQAVEGYPSWLCTDCGCCAGIKLGGEEPRMCRDCQGSGMLYLHLPTGIQAIYPGGPIVGKLSKAELAAWPAHEEYQRLIREGLLQEYTSLVGTPVLSDWLEEHDCPALAIAWRGANSKER